MEDVNDLREMGYDPVSLYSERVDIWSDGDSSALVERSNGEILEVYE